MPYILLLQVMNDELLPLYQSQIDKRQEQRNNGELMDSGFDLYCPDDIKFEFSMDYKNQPDRTKLVDLGIRAAAYEVRHFDESQVNSLSKDLCRPYSLKCRSSIYKSNFRLANCEGVIDAGYRGNIKAPVDWSMFYSKPKGKSSMESLFTMQKHARYFQLCMPTLTPFQVYIVEQLDDTKRGEGGFGSTGK